MLGRSPLLNRLIGIACYLFGTVIMIVNIYYSQRYFHYLLVGNPDETLDSLMWWSTWAIAGGMGAYEAVCIGLITTPIAWNFMFSLPQRLERIRNASQKQVANWALIIILILATIACVAVYIVDFSTTFGGLTAYRAEEDLENMKSGFSFLTMGLVFGSEVMFVGGNLCLWLALIGAAQTSRMKKTMEQEIQDVQGEHVLFNGSAHAPVRNNRRINLS